MTPGGGSLWRREPWLLALVGAIAVLDALVAVLQHGHFETGLDLSLADQAVWNYSHFHAAHSSILAKDILGDHFSPLVAILTPLYWIWSDPRMLLIAQSALAASSVVPVFLFACQRLGRRAGYVVAVASACYWPTQVGVAFDFHELAFAPLLIALMILYADRRRWLPMWVTAVLLLCVKEDMAVLVVFLGVYLLTLREWRHGLALVLAGIVWYELAVKVAIPDLSHGAGYAHWTYGQLGKDLPHALLALLKAPWKLVTIAVSPFRKVETIAALMTPFLFMALGSRLFILAIPLLAERFLSTDPLFWQTHFQYSMPIAPVIAMAAVNALAKLRAWLPARLRPVAVGSGTAAMAVTSVVVSLVLSGSALARIVDGYAFTTPANAAGAAEAVNHVPAGAPLATVNDVLPHASERPDIQLLGPRTAVLVPFLDVNVVDPGCCGSLGEASVASLMADTIHGLATMTPVFYDHGWLVARRAPHPTNGVLTPMPAPAARRLQQSSGAGDQAVAAAFSCRGPRALSCLVGPLSKILVVLRRTASELASLEPRLTGGCTELAGAAAGATGELVEAVGPLIAAAAHGDRVAYGSAYATEQSEIANLALAERTPLLLALCTPRGT